MWTFYSKFYDTIMFWDCLFIFFFKQQIVSQQRILIHEDSMNLLSLYTSPSLPNITLGLPAVPTQLNVSHYTAAQVIFSEGNSVISCVFRLQGNLVEFASPRIHLLHSKLCKDVQFDFKLKNYTGSQYVIYIKTITNIYIMFYSF